jgi:glycosyltransferase involved in cell wall biosynthesis
MRHPIIIVAALTYRRPEMLTQLLLSLSVLERPDGWEVWFLIVDNDPGGSGRPAIDAVTVRYGGSLHYVVESEPGIPFARNRALREAIDRGAALLCFLDDDEIPDPRWLRELLAHRDATDAVLIGGPTRLLPPTDPLGPWKRFLARSLLARSEFLESYLARCARQGRLVKLATNNWMADLAWVRDHDLRFDTAMRFTGGSDTAFLYALQAKGGKASWCTRAIVHERLQPERLSLGYQFRRAKLQALVQAQLKPQSALWLLLTQPIRVMLGVALMIFPVYGRASFALGLERIGRAVGRLSSLWGARSLLYSRES